MQVKVSRYQDMLQEAEHGDVAAALWARSGNMVVVGICGIYHGLAQISSEYGWVLTVWRKRNQVVENH
eukprot:1152185-Pelagomonas_calceolata.AAC.4